MRIEELGRQKIVGIVSSRVTTGHQHAPAGAGVDEDAIIDPELIALVCDAVVIDVVVIGVIEPVEFCLGGCEGEPGSDGARRYRCRCGFTDGTGKAKAREGECRDGKRQTNG